LTRSGIQPIRTYRQHANINTDLSSPNTWLKIALSNKIILGILFLAIAITAIFSTTNGSLNKTSHINNIIPITENRSFDIKIPIALKNELYGDDRITGIIIEDDVSISGSFEDAIAVSKENVTKNISSEYILSDIPLYPTKEEIDSDKTVQNKFKKTGRLSFKVVWLSYSAFEANSLFIKELENSAENEENYEVKNIEILTVKNSDNPDILYLTGKVDISLNKLTE
jgi:hypothetical protein